MFFLVSKFPNLKFFVEKKWKNSANSRENVINKKIAKKMKSQFE